MQTKALFAGRLLFVPLLHPGLPTRTSGPVLAAKGQSSDFAVRKRALLRGILGEEPHPGLIKRCSRFAIENIRFDNRPVLAGDGDVAPIVEGLLQRVKHLCIATQNRRPAFKVFVLCSRRQFQRIRIKLWRGCTFLPGHTRVSSIWRLVSPEICTSDGDEWPENCGEFSRSRAPWSTYLSKRVAFTAAMKPLKEPNISLTEEGSYTQLPMHLANFRLPDSVP